MSLYTGQNAVFVKTSIREMRKPLDNALGVGVEDVWPVRMDAYTVFVVSVICVTSNVVTLVNHQNLATGFGQHAGTHSTSKTGTNNEDIGFHNVILLATQR